MQTRRPQPQEYTALVEIWSTYGRFMVDLWLMRAYHQRIHPPMPLLENLYMSQSQTLFSTVHQSDPNKFWATESGELNARAVADFLELDSNDVSKIAHVSKASVRYDKKIPNDVLQHLSQVANICNLVTEALNNDIAKTSLWFRTPNPLLGEVTPRDMIRMGRYEKLKKFILDAMGRGRTGRSVNRK